MNKLSWARLRCVWGGWIQNVKFCNNIKHIAQFFKRKILYICILNKISKSYSKAYIILHFTQWFLESIRLFFFVYFFKIYDKIINICDLFCTNEFVTIDRRLIDVYIRRGVYDNTVYHIKSTIALKRELEDMMGCGLYSLFPEIIDNFNKKHRNLYHEFRNH